MPKRYGLTTGDFLDEFLGKLDELIDAVQDLTTVITTQAGTIIDLEEQQMADLSALQQEVSDNADVTQSAVTLLQGLNQALQDAIAADDPEAVQAIVDQLSASTDSLAEAVANVPHPEQQ